MQTSPHRVYSPWRGGTMAGRRTSPLTDLIVDATALRQSTRDDQDACTRFAALLGAFTRRYRHVPEWLCETSSECYVQHLVHVSPRRDFSIVALAWLPGQCTPIHDHLSWCAVSVWEGAECETRYRHVGNGTLVQISRRVLRAGDTTVFTDANDVHYVENCAANVTVSLHAYGVDLSVAGSSIRSCYPKTALARSSSTADRS